MTTNYFQYSSVPLRVKKGRKIKKVDYSKSAIYIFNNNLDYLSFVLNVKKTTLAEYSSWFLIDGEFYYFKSEYAFRELFMSLLLNEFDLKGVNYEIIKYNDNYGIISKNIRKKNREYLYYDEFDEDLNNEDLNRSLSKVLTFDLFTGQYDRGSYNLLFEKKSSGIYLAPLIDNGRCLCLSPHRLYSCIRDIYLPLDITSLDDEESESIEYIKTDNEMIKYMIKCLDIDIRGILSRTIKRYNLIINNSSRDQIVSYFDNNKKIIESSLKLILK